jgi:arabinofuranosyltransferase
MPNEGAPRLRAVTILVAECALVIACLSAHFRLLWVERWVQDDAYVSFRYARNLVRGHGLVYNVGEPVEGYTNFLWTLLAALPLAGGADDPLPFMHLASAALWVASYVLLLLIAIRLWAAGVWAAPLGLLPLALHWSFNMWFFSGMETPLVTFLVTAAVGCVTLDPRQRRWSLLGMSACAIGLMMTRPDGAIVYAALLLVVAALDGGWLVREASASQRRFIVLSALAPLILVWLPYQAWRVWYYGSFFPNTYYAKVAYLTYYERGWRYLREYLLLYGLMPFAILPLSGAVMAVPGAASRFLWAAVMVSAAVAWYVVRLGGDFMEWRFVTPVTGVFYLAIVTASGVIGERLAALRESAAARRYQIGWVTGALAAALLAAVTGISMQRAQMRSVPDQETIALLRRYTDPGRFDWRAAGALCDSVLPPAARIATTSAGIIPYFCDRHCLDLHGLTDPIIAREPVDEVVRGRMGHEHWLQDYGLIRARGVDVVIEWADPHDYPRAVTRAPEDGHQMVSARLPDGRFIDFTVLRPDLLQALRTDPRMVAYDRTKIFDRDTFYTLPRLATKHRVVDELDWAAEASETAHGFEEHQYPHSPYQHSWHTKLLRYRAPVEDVQLEDDGRRIDGWAQWTVFNVSAQSDLILVGRHDHTGSARYEVEVNGRPVEMPLVAPGRPDPWWGESWVRIPKHLLVAGANTIRIVRDPNSERDAEWYYMWFLQPDVEGAAPSAPGGAGVGEIGSAD